MNITRAGDLLDRLFKASLIALCLTVWFAANIQAQVLTNDVTTNATERATGWWSQETAKLVGFPDLQLGSADHARFGGAGFFLTSPLEPRDAGASDALYHSNALYQSLKTNSDLLRPGSLLYPLQTRYLLWESRLSDNLTLTNQQRGALVYPLVQIDFAGNRLPITLYTPPLRGSEARR